MAQNVVKIPVLPHIWKYIFKTYNFQDRFDLTISQTNPMRVALLQMTAIAEILPQEERAARMFIHLDLGDDPHLLRAYEEKRPYIANLSFFQHQFNVHLDTYMRLSLHNAHHILGLTQQEWNARKALEAFLDYYEIEEHEYTYESLRRQWNRVRHLGRTYILDKLYEKFQFCTHSWEGYVRPCTFIKGQRPRLSFSTYSRSRGKVHRYYLTIPQKAIRTGKMMEWVDTAAGLIDDQLKKKASAV